MFTELKPQNQFHSRQKIQLFILSW